MKNSPLKKEKISIEKKSCYTKNIDLSRAKFIKIKKFLRGFKVRFLVGLIHISTKLSTKKTNFGEKNFLKKVKNFLKFKWVT